jgi:hypothetical protein
MEADEPRRQHRRSDRFRRSRELFSFANFVYTNSTNVLDSSPLLWEATRLLFEALLEEDTSPLENDEHTLESMAERVRKKSDERGIFAFRLWEHLDLLEKAHRAFSEPSIVLSREELQAYAVVVARMPEVYAAASRYLRGRIVPPDRRRRAAILRIVVPGVLVIAFAAWAFGPTLYEMTFKRGIQASFYRGENFEKLVHERVDWSIDFSWGAESPDKDVPADYFSARWKGVLRVPRDGTYTFYLRSDDGSRLFIDGRLVLDHWEVTNESVEVSAEVPLREGHVPVVVELFEHDGGAALHLAWKSPHMETAIIAQKYWAH